MDELLTRFAAHHDNAGIFLDFDGTLSEIVHRPADARPVEGARELLENLAHAYRLVALVSGRSAHQLLEWLGSDIEIWGVHGAERTVDGAVQIGERVRPFVDLMRVVHDEAAAAVERLGLDGVVIEDKGVMVGLHFRAATDQARARRELDDVATMLAAKYELRRGGGRLAYELRPPIELSKKAVVLERAAEERLGAAAFVGDDLVDLPAWDALDELAETGVVTLRVGVDSTEVPAEVIERADVVVPGPTGVLAFLREMIDLAGR
jgi:trehalose 6-phosphate phosphatase